MSFCTTVKASSVLAFYDVYCLECGSKSTRADCSSYVKLNNLPLLPLLNIFPNVSPSGQCSGYLPCVFPRNDSSRGDQTGRLRLAGGRSSLGWLSLPSSSRDLSLDRERVGGGGAECRSGLRRLDRSSGAAPAHTTALQREVGGSHRILLHHCSRSPPADPPDESSPIRRPRRAQIVVWWLRYRCFVTGRAVWPEWLCGGRMTIRCRAGPPR